MMDFDVMVYKQSKMIDSSGRSPKRREYDSVGKWAMLVRWCKALYMVEYHMLYEFVISNIWNFQSKSE